MKFATFNALFTGDFDQTAEIRLKPTVEAITDINADVLCLQEIFYRDDIDYFTNALNNSPKWAGSDVYVEFTQEEITEIPCGVQDNTPLFTIQMCVMTNCIPIGEESLASCILANCAAEIDSPTPECTQCLAANIILNDFAEITKTCTSEAQGTLLFGGHNGLIMVSKQEIKNKDYIEIEDSVVEQKGALYGEVDGIQIACGHIAAEAPIPYGGQHQSYQGQNAYELNTILFFLNKKENGSPQVLIGDLNTGPAFPE